MPQLDTATLGGGCFWCLEAVFERVRGVAAVVSGYCGGSLANPTYQQVCEGHSGHAEVVQVRFDPERIGYRELLEVFFAIHDATTPNRQGNDVGTQYRSVIFTHSDEQERTAHALIAELAAARAYDGPIVTEVRPAPTFWPAEAHHQQYFDNHGRQPYCQVVIAPKLAKFRNRFGGLVQEPN